MKHLNPDLERLEERVAPCIGLGVSLCVGAVVEVNNSGDGHSEGDSNNGSHEGSNGTGSSKSGHESSGSHSSHSS